MWDIVEKYALFGFLYLLVVGSIAVILTFTTEEGK